MTFRQLLLTPLFSCTCSHAHSIALLLSFFISLLSNIATSTPTFLMMSSSQSLPDCSLAGLKQTLKGRGSFICDGLLLSSCQFKFDESAGDSQHIYPQPSTLNSIYVPSTTDSCSSNAQSHKHIQYTNLDTESSLSYVAEKN